MSEREGKENSEVSASQAGENPGQWEVTEVKKGYRPHKGRPKKWPWIWRQKEHQHTWTVMTPCGDSDGGGDRTVSVMCHYVTNHQVFTIWLLFLMILRFDRQFLCSTEFQVVSWEDYSHLESVKLEHPARMEFNADSQLEAPLGLWTRVTTCGLSMS